MSGPRRGGRDRDRRGGSGRPGRETPASGRPRPSGDSRSQAREGRPARAGQRPNADPRRGAGRTRAGDIDERAERTSRIKAPTNYPPVPEDADPTLLERGVRAELRSLSKPNAEAVARHLVAAGHLVDSNPRLALEHARAARARAGRVGAVREAVGIAAYHAGEWAEALTELRAARRISGDPRNLPVIADCERALGKPEQAARVLSDPEVRRLDGETRAELLIVVAGARRDLGQLEAALSVLARGGLDKDRPRPGSARLWYAYADALEAAGRRDEAAAWFAASAGQDPDGELDSADRAAALL
jgi:tetratricopeptide (TPR) repeat protein